MRLRQSANASQKALLEIRVTFAVPRSLRSHCLNDRKQIFRAVRQFIHDEMQIVFLLFAPGDIDVDAYDLSASLMLNHPRPPIDPTRILVRSNKAQLKLELSAGSRLLFFCTNVIEADLIVRMYALAKSR